MNKKELPKGELDWIPLGKLSIYPISEHELDSLERGSPDSIFLTFGVASLSVGFTSLLSLLTLESKDAVVLIVFVCVTIIGLLAGVVLMALWLHYRKHTSDVLSCVRKRKKPHGEQLGTSDLQPAGTAEVGSELIFLIEGKWKWQGSLDVEIRNTGDVSCSTGESATFTPLDLQARWFVLRWDSGWVDFLELSEDGRLITGKNQKGGKVTGEKIDEC